jgi:hypothetical protein
MDAAGRRVTVEVLEPASTRASHFVYVRVINRQSVRLGDKPLETHDQYFFLQLNTVIVVM